MTVTAGDSCSVFCRPLTASIAEPSHCIIARRPTSLLTLFDWLVFFHETFIIVRTARHLGTEIRDCANNHKMSLGSR